MNRKMTGRRKISYSAYVRMAASVRRRLKAGWKYVGFGNWILKRKTRKKGQARRRSRR